MSGGYAVASVVPKRLRRHTVGANQIKPARQYLEERPMKLTIKQRIRQWLMNDDQPDECYAIEDSNGPDLNSQSFRLSVYGASGGTIIETTKYDRKSDENRHSLHIVAEDKDLGEELAKIITMEQLR
jgi:hypothetical protein